MERNIISKSCLTEIYKDNTGILYSIYVCRHFLCLKSSTHCGLLCKLPFKNCLDPRLSKHNRLLILTYLEKSADSCYHLRFFFPLNTCIQFSPGLKYSRRPFYSISVLDNEFFLHILCDKKYSTFHLKINPDDNTCFMKRLSFYNG